QPSGEPQDQAEYSEPPQPPPQVQPRPFNLQLPHPRIGGARGQDGGVAVRVALVTEEIGAIGLPVAPSPEAVGLAPDHEDRVAHSAGSDGSRSSSVTGGSSSDSSRAFSPATPDRSVRPSRRPNADSGTWRN